MLKLLPWPEEMHFFPIANLKCVPGTEIETMNTFMDRLAQQNAHRVGERNNSIFASGMTQGYREVFWNNNADFSAFSTSSSEGSLLGGVNEQPAFPPFTFDQGNRAKGRSFGLEAWGTLGTASTPTITFQLRLGTTVGSSYLSGTSLGVSAAITTQSGVSNQQWSLTHRLTVYTTGLGSGNCTLSAAGWVQSPGGFASPFIYPLQPTAPNTSTWTLTVDPTVTQYVNLSVTWSASSSSNTITCKNFLAFCDN